MSRLSIHPSDGTVPKASRDRHGTRARNLPDKAGAAMRIEAENMIRDFRAMRAVDRVSFVVETPMMIGMIGRLIHGQARRRRREARPSD